MRSSHASFWRTSSMVLSMRLMEFTDARRPARFGTAGSGATAANAVLSSGSSPDMMCIMTITYCMKRKNSARSMVPLPFLSKTAANFWHCSELTFHGSVSEN